MNGIKEYQGKALDAFEVFLTRCRETGNIRESFAQCTEDNFKHALPYHGLPGFPHIPYVCLRIPTGGGKTLIGGLAIKRVNTALLYAGYSLTIWLTPTETIQKQTIRDLRDPSHILHQRVSAELGRFEVIVIADALRLKPHVLNATNVIVVATMQSFKQENMDKLNVYKENSDMKPYFEGISDANVIGNMSFVDMLKQRHPFVIVDEAHNQGTPLAFETLGRMDPIAILELTATPDRVHQPSNVLYSVSAATLKSESMIKMPLNLFRRSVWQDTLRDAITCLNSLSEAASSEPKYLRPIMLIQAEKKHEEKETLIPIAIKNALINDFGIPEAEIKIVTGELDEIGETNIQKPDSPVRIIITIDKLKEGWDCSFAYVLCSFRNTASATAAEQILGRILRMPNVKEKANQLLNEAYIYVSSADFVQTVQSLRDGLVKNGFERQEIKDLFNAQDPELMQDLLSFEKAIFAFEAPEIPAPETIPSIIRSKVEISPEDKTITLIGEFSKKQEEALMSVFTTHEGKQAIAKAFIRKANPPQLPKTPSEMGVTFPVPGLAVKQGSIWDHFEETHLLQGDWKITDFSSDLAKGDFDMPRDDTQRGQIILDEKEQIKIRFLEIEKQMAMFEFHSGWAIEDLTEWLEQNIYDDSITPDEKAAFLLRAVKYLINVREFKVDDLAYAKFSLRTALEKKIADVKKEAKKTVYDKLISLDDNFDTVVDAGVIFEHGRYAYNRVYRGSILLPKHFFPEIGDLEETSEEFGCAKFLACDLPEVEFWVRNISQKRLTSFSLQTSSDRFYPDFVCKLKDGRILVVEYKGDRYNEPENIEKRQLGELWERRSKGKCLFIMTEGKDWKAIEDKVRSIEK